MDDLTREFLIESQEGLDRMERCLTELENRPDDLCLLADIFRSVHTIKGATGFLGFTRLETLAHAGENLLGMLRDGRLKASTVVIGALLQLLDRLRAILTSIETHGDEGGDTHQALLTQLEALQSFDETRMARPFGAPALEPRIEPASAIQPLHPSALPAASTSAPSSFETAEPAPPARTVNLPAPGTSTAESTLRVDISLLNRMMNLVGELVLTRNQVLQATAADPGMTLLSRRLDMVTADLREAVMKARLQPISNLFSKMPRVVRDLGQTLGRQVRLEMEGGETELDKSLLEAIKDPLNHAVRNALDHGIENPEIRCAAGKPPEGLLRLRAAQEGSHVLIDIADDGAGISVDRVRQKAIERGLVTAERAAQLSDGELLQYIFVPGFSTAASVTHISGRGVGMDVVRTNVERIGGKVEIDSRLGHGTTLRLRIPLTLAIVPALIVRSLGQSFALPQGALSELVHVSSHDAASVIEWIDNAPLYRIRGRLLPLVFLENLLTGRDARDILHLRNFFIAILDADGRRFGLVVDGLADPEEIVVKPLSAALKAIGIFSGATVLGNGDLALILDPVAIALRSRVSLQAAPSNESLDSASVDSAGRIDYLLVEIAGRREAIPLGSVLRIEQVPGERIEYIDCCPLLHVGGELLPIRDDGHLLSISRHTAATVVVVGCCDAPRQVGIAVSSVLEVSAGSRLREPGSSNSSPGVTLLNGRVTHVLDPSVVGAGGIPFPPRDPARVRGEAAMKTTESQHHAPVVHPTAAPAEMCRVRLADRRFGVPICHVIEILGKATPHPVPLAPRFIGGIVSYRGDVLTAVNLRHLLDLPPVNFPQDILVVEGPDSTFGLLVDSVDEVTTAEASAWEPNPATLNERGSALFAGAYKATGTLIVMLKLEQLDPVRLARLTPRTPECEHSS